METSHRFLYIRALDAIYYGKIWKMPVRSGMKCHVAGFQVKRAAIKAAL
jgi:hypothetical protein